MIEGDAIVVIVAGGVACNGITGTTERDAVPGDAVVPVIISNVACNGGVVVGRLEVDSIFSVQVCSVVGYGVVAGRVEPDTITGF